MPYLKASVPFISAFTLIELVIVMAVLALIVTAGMGISFSQYDQWMALAKREIVLDSLIENRANGVGTSSTVIVSSFGSFSEPITVYENGELEY